MLIETRVTGTVERIIYRYSGWTNLHNFLCRAYLAPSLMKLHWFCGAVKNQGRVFFFSYVIGARRANLPLNVSTLWRYLEKKFLRTIRKQNAKINEYSTIIRRIRFVDFRSLFTNRTVYFHVLVIEASRRHWFSSTRNDANIFSFFNAFQSIFLRYRRSDLRMKINRFGETLVWKRPAVVFTVRLCKDGG